MNANSIQVFKQATFKSKRDPWEYSSESEEDSMPLSTDEESEDSHIPLMKITDEVCSSLF